MIDYDLIPQGSEHVEAPYVPEPDGWILLPGGTEHVLLPAVVEVVEDPENDVGGRPYVFVAAKQVEYLDRIRAGDGRELAAHNVGVSPNTVRTHRKQFPEFEAEMIEAEGVANATVVNALFVNATEKMNVTAQVFWVTNRLPDEWQDRRGPRVLQQINTGAPSVEWSLQEARAEAFGIVDELEERRVANEAKAAGAIDVASSEVDGG